MDIPILFDMGDQLFVDWGDGNNAIYKSIPVNHTYAALGDYTINIFGSALRFGSGKLTYSSAPLIISVDQWGSLGLKSLSGAFHGATNLIRVPENLPSGIKDMSYMFALASMFNQDLTLWDVSTVKDMFCMFFNALSFNGNISTWNTSSVVSTSTMFGNAKIFNRDLSQWDVSHVEDMSAMFGIAEQFNQDLSKWDVSNVKNASSMFLAASSFNQDISNWKVSNMKDISHMFNSALSFNQNLSSWKLPLASDAKGIFEDCPMRTNLALYPDFSESSLPPTTDSTYYTMMES
jgi:hypothetical protein